MDSSLLKLRQDLLHQLHLSTAPAAFSQVLFDQYALLRSKWCRHMVLEDISLEHIIVEVIIVLQKPSGEILNSHLNPPLSENGLRTPGVSPGVKARSQRLQVFVRSFDTL
jgi:hypothetical protein